MQNPLGKNLHFLRSCFGGETFKVSHLQHSGNNVDKPVVDFRFARIRRGLIQSTAVCRNTGHHGNATMWDRFTSHSSVNSHQVLYRPLWRAEESVGFNLGRPSPLVALNLNRGQFEQFRSPGGF